jgi:hypothetical protein
MEVKFTPEMEAAIRAAAPLNQAKAEALGATLGKSARSITAKAIRMNVPYERKANVSKTGESVIRKETLVEEIAKFVPGNLDGLEKASKNSLQAVLARLIISEE